MRRLPVTGSCSTLSAAELRATLLATLFAPDADAVTVLSDAGEAIAFAAGATLDDASPPAEPSARPWRTDVERWLAGSADFENRFDLLNMISP